MLHLAAQIAHPDVKRGFIAIRSETVGLDDFQIYLDPEFKVLKKFGNTLLNLSQPNSNF